MFNLFLAPSVRNLKSRGQNCEILQSVLRHQQMPLAKFHSYVLGFVGSFQVFSPEPLRGKPNRVAPRYNLPVIYACERMVDKVVNEPIIFIPDYFSST